MVNALSFLRVKAGGGPVVLLAIKLQHDPHVEGKSDHLHQGIFWYF